MPEAGHRRYRDAGAAWLRRVGLDVPSERVMITGGAQHAFAMTMLALARPNDVVLTERLTFPGIPEAIRLAGARPVGVAMDAEGALPEDLDRAARVTGARLAILTPTIHNPCTAMMSLRRRRAIAAVLRARDLILIEDDVYGVLPQTRPSPIAEFAPERTIYVVSASKCLTPGLGVGWLTAPAPLQDRLGSVLHAMSQSLPTLGPEIVTRWIEDGTAERLVREQRAEAATRHAIAAASLRGFSWRGRRDSLHAFIELPEPWREEHFLAEAMRRGVIACSARAFAVDEQAAPNAVRVALGAPRDHETLQRALGILVQLATSGESARTVRRRVV
jgi:DNA-binding transcriptional MocR family regulator